MSLIEPIKPMLTAQLEQLSGANSFGPSCSRSGVSVGAVGAIAPMGFEETPIDHGREFEKKPTRSTYPRVG